MYIKMVPEHQINGTYVCMYTYYISFKDVHMSFYFKEVIWVILYQCLSNPMVTQGEDFDCLQLGLASCLLKNRQNLSIW